MESVNTASLHRQGHHGNTKHKNTVDTFFINTGNTQSMMMPLHMQPEI